MENEEYMRKTGPKVWDAVAGLVYESQLQAWEEYYPEKTTKQVLKWNLAKIILSKTNKKVWNETQQKYHSAKITKKSE